MFQLLPCSRCQRTFSVRSEVSDEALLKCPNCGNQFRLGELLDAFYAPWEILENPGVSGAASAAVGPMVAAPLSGLSRDETEAASSSAVQGSGVAIASTSAQEDGLSLDGPDLELAEEVEETSPGISLDGATKEKPKTDWSQFKPITHEEFQRMKRADRSPIWSTLQVVLGGAAAIPVSLLLIWYVLDKDVAGAGPAVARYLPWIVPEKFRGAGQLEPTEPIAEPSRVPRRGESGFRNFDDVMPQAEDGSANGESEDSKESEPAPADEEKADVVGTLAESDIEPEASSSDPNASQPQPPIADEAPPEPADTADLPMADVFAQLQRVKQKVEEWQDVATAEANVKREAALSLFEDLASLGAHFSTIPDTLGAPALARDKAQEISRAIKRQPDLIQVLYSAARAQVTGTWPRPKNGWVLVCTVGEILEQDEVWRIMVADATLLTLDVPTIEIPKSVAPQLTSGQRLLLLGTFITPPATEADAASADNSDQTAPGPEVFRASFSYGL